MVVAMATEYETGLLFDECWKELRKLHKTLAELGTLRLTVGSILNAPASSRLFPTCS
jgi:hypothetical protein